MRIAIASGKGGARKTGVVASFAAPAGGVAIAVLPEHAVPEKGR